MSTHELYGAKITLAQLAKICAVSEEEMDRRLLATDSITSALVAQDRGLLVRISAKYGIEHSTLHARIKSGLSARDAVFKPLRPTNAAKPGDKFGRLTLLTQCGKTAAAKPIWSCRCDCGTETTAVLADLKSGQKKSCGCLHREGGRKRMLARSGLDAMIGQTFHRLTVLRRVEGVVATVLCRCVCGVEREFHSTNVLNGTSKSCGCLKSESSSANAKARATIVHTNGGPMRLQDIATRAGIKVETMRCRLARGLTVEEAVALGPKRVRRGRYSTS